MIDWIMGFVVRSGYLGAFADPKTCIARRATRVEGRDMKHPFTGSGDPGRSAEQAYMITAGVGGPNGAAMVAIRMTEKSGLAYRALRLTPTPRPVGRSVIGAAP